jgi:DNA-binding NarL/FixJ family response regulator
MASIRTLLIDDLAFYMNQLAVRLGREPDLDVLPVATDLPQARVLLDTLSPAVMVFDVYNARLDGLQLLEEVREHHPRCLPVILTSTSHPEDAVAAVRRGARAWLTMPRHSEQLARVIRGVCQGEYWIPPDILGHVLRQLAPAVSAPCHDPLGLLTSRERDVLQCAVDGLSNRQIARRLYLSPHTVRTHTRNMLNKLDAHSMAEMVTLARRSGMRPAPEDALTG